MVAIANFLPDKPRDRDEVNAILNANPEVAKFISHFSAWVTETYDDVNVVLEPEKYEEWDPPLNLIFYMPMTSEQYNERWDHVVGHALSDPTYDRNLLHVAVRHRSSNRRRSS